MVHVARVRTNSMYSILILIINNSLSIIIILKLFSMDGVTYKGKVQKEYAGFVKEMFTLADNFSIDC